MRILLAGSVYADDTISFEIDGYKAKGHEIMINTHYLSDINKDYLSKKYSNDDKVSFCQYHPGKPEELKAAITYGDRGFDAVIYPPNENGFTPDVINAALKCNNKLKAIACPNDALSHLDPVKEIADQNHINLIKAHDIHPRPVAEYTLMQMLNQTRNVEHLQDITGKDGNFPHQEAVSTTHTIKGKTIGIIGGSGKDGLGVIEVMKAMGLKVIATAKNSIQDRLIIERSGAEAVSLNDLLSRSDFISVNCRRDHSINLLDEAAILQMKKGVIIINPSGADIINKQALFNQLELSPENRTIRQVVFDMPYGGERDENAFRADPDNIKLKELGVKFTPRMAGSTIEARLDGVKQLIEYVNRVLDGNYHSNAGNNINNNPNINRSIK